VNERSSKPSRCAGVVATACTQGKRAQHGKLQGVVRDGQPDAREGQAGRHGVAERFVVPMKPGNAGGGKGPQFKAGAESGDAQEIGVTLRNSGNVRELRKAPHAEVKDRPGSQSGERMSAQVAALAVAWRTTVQNYGRGFTIPAVARVAYARPSVSERMRLVREPDAGDLHVRFDERDVETGLRQGYVGTVRRKRRQQTSQTYCYRATSRLYRAPTLRSST
jgi:hypothetical protein